LKPIKYIRYDIGYADVDSGSGAVVSAGFMEYDAAAKGWGCFG
jgi:hypothetical protein